MHSKLFTSAAISLLAGSQTASAHSWVEALWRIGADGAFAGEQGYPIGFVERGVASFSDAAAQNKILDAPATGSNPAVCKPAAGAYAQHPRLRAGAGDYVALQYQDNGHVTDPTQTERPYRGGNVYVYGTAQHQDADGVYDVLNAWTADGQGGNKKGRLLASHYYDDGVCYQNRGGAAGFPVYTERHAKYGQDEVFCQSDIQLPDDLPADGSTYTLMWVWDWPRIIDDSQNVTEIYTSCAEIQLTKGSGAGKPQVPAGGPADIKSAAIPTQIQTLIEATALGVGTQSPAPVADAAAPTGGNNNNNKNNGNNNNDAPVKTTTQQAAPAVTSAPSQSNAAGAGAGNGMMTVTVTAEPATVTELHTVTVGGGNGNTQVAGSQQPAPTAAPTNGPPSVTPFLKARARVTGAARRRTATGSAE